MRLFVDAACGCNTGKIRRNNEDNFFFDNKCLELENRGLEKIPSFSDVLKDGLCFAVFDGMGGENFGEIASYAAVRQMQQMQRGLSDFLISESNYLKRLTHQLDSAVGKMQQQMQTDRMGTTMVSLYFAGKYVYVCNVGDSRAYRLRDGEFLQLSQDHVEKQPANSRRKAALTQYLGFGSDETELDPYIAKGQLKTGDQYLLCSDGLSDMLTNFEISDIMLNSEDAENCVQELINAALEHGGRDNITAIVCRIE